MRNLDYYLQINKLKNNHFRYMPESVKNEIIALTKKCTGKLDERWFWIINNMSDYPKCKICDIFLSSKSYFASSKQGGNGYRSYCGKSCAHKDPNYKNRVQENMMQKYGVQHTSKLASVQMKKKLTNLEKYGNANPIAWDSDKFRSIIENLYGVEKVRHIDGIGEKIAKTKQKLLYDNLPDKIMDLENSFDVKCVFIPLNITRMDDAEITWQHKCGYQYTSGISFRGIKQCPRCSHGSSKAENEIGDWIESLGIKVIRRTKDVIGKELDIWLPDFQLGIEYDGTYWHSAKFCSKEKSMEKKKLLENLITIQEHSYVWKANIVKSRLLSMFGKTQKVMARKCKVKQIDNNEAYNFFNNTHLQGSARSEISIGLFFEEELISCMSFGKPRFARKDAVWELIRFSSKLNTNVLGGASKMLKFFRSFNEGSIISYADRCWSSGNVYTKLGFKFIRNSDPSYFWVSSNFMFTRYQTQKKKLPKLFDKLGYKFEPSLSEFDNMAAAGYLQVFDRGTSVWLLD